MHYNIPGIVIILLTNPWDTTLRILFEPGIWYPGITTLPYVPETTKAPVPRDDDS